MTTTTKFIFIQPTTCFLRPGGCVLCLFISQQNISKSCGRILTKLAFQKSKTNLLSVHALKSSVYTWWPTEMPLTLTPCKQGKYTLESYYWKWLLRINFLCIWHTLSKAKSWVYFWKSFSKVSSEYSAWYWWMHARFANKVETRRAIRSLWRNTSYITSMLTLFTAVRV